MGWIPDKLHCEPSTAPLFNIGHSWRLRARRLFSKSVGVRKAAETLQEGGATDSLGDTPGGGIAAPGHSRAPRGGTAALGYSCVPCDGRETLPATASLMLNANAGLGKLSVRRGETRLGIIHSLGPLEELEEMDEDAACLEDLDGLQDITTGQETTTTEQETTVTEQQTTTIEQETTTIEQETIVEQNTIITEQDDVIAEQEAIITEQEAIIAEQEAIIAELRKSEAAVREACVYYEKHRKRFLAGFKRDVLNTATKEDLKLIASANALVHGGNMMFDKRFYLGDEKRSDESTFTALYGLAPLDAKRLSMLASTRAFRITSFRADG